MYQAETDPYCYHDSSVLKNKAGLTDQAALEEYETAMTFARSLEALPPGGFSITHYRAVHRHLFQDVYTWAGRFRRIRISKGTSAFCYPEHIAPEMRRLFLWLKQSRNSGTRPPQTLQRSCALSWSPRDPSFSRGQWANAIDVFYARKRAGHPLDLDRLDTDAVLDAMIQSFSGNEEPLRMLIQELIV